MFIVVTFMFFALGLVGWILFNHKSDPRKSYVSYLTKTGWIDIIQEEIYWRERDAARWTTEDAEGKPRPPASLRPTWKNSWNQEISQKEVDWHTGEAIRILKI